MLYHRFTTFQTDCFGLLRSAAVIVSAAIAMALPSMAHAMENPLTCQHLTLADVTIGPQPVEELMSPPTPAGIGQAFATGPKFESAPSDCNGFTATDWSVTYVPNIIGGNMAASVVIDFFASFEIHFMPHAPNVENVQNVVAVDGTASWTSGIQAGANLVEIETYFNGDPSDGLANLDTGNFSPPCSPFPNQGCDIGFIAGPAFSKPTKLNNLPCDTVADCSTLDLAVVISFSQTANPGTLTVTFPDSIIVAAVSPVPEPGSLVLLASALAGLAGSLRPSRSRWLRRCRRRA